MGFHQRSAWSKESSYRFHWRKKIAGRGKNNFKEPEVRSHLIGLMKSKEVSIAGRDTDEFIKTAREQIIDRADSCFEWGENWAPEGSDQQNDVILIYFKRITLASVSRNDYGWLWRELENKITKCEKWRWLGLKW